MDCYSLFSHAELLPTAVRKDERHLRKKVMPSLRLCGLWPWLSLVWSGEEHERTNCRKGKIQGEGSNLMRLKNVSRPLQVSVAVA